MRTPSEYSNNIKKRIITEKMLIDCLYSSNKRAKNYRDKECEYRNYYRCNPYAYDKYNNVDKCKTKKLEYYEQKEILLSIIKPTCIHKERVGYKKIRIYDYEKNYKKNVNNFVWENCFLDRETGLTIWFGDILDYNQPIYHHYLFYQFASDSRTFHTPITKDNLNIYSYLEIIDIDALQTKGHDIGDLLSNQFVKKVINLIQSEDYHYIAEGES